MQETRTGPYAVRADIQHEVSHDAKKLPFLLRFQHIRRWPPTNAGKTMCSPEILQYYYVCMYIYIHIDDSIIEIFQNVSLITNQNNTLFRTPRSCIKAAKRFSKHQKRHRQTNKYGHTNDIPPMISHYIPL